MARAAKKKKRRVLIAINRLELLEADGSGDVAVEKIIRAAIVPASFLIASDRYEKRFG